MGVAQWISIGSVVVAALSLTYVIIKDSLNNAREGGKMSVIMKGVDDKLEEIKSKMERSEGRIETIAERLTRVEESTKSAHHRIDGIENKMNLEEK